MAHGSDFLSFFCSALAFTCNRFFQIFYWPKVPNSLQNTLPPPPRLRQPCASSHSPACNSAIPVATKQEGGTKRSYYEVSFVDESCGCSQAFAVSGFGYSIKVTMENSLVSGFMETCGHDLGKILFDLITSLEQSGAKYAALYVSNPLRLLRKISRLQMCDLSAKLVGRVGTGPERSDGVFEVQNVAKCLGRKRFSGYLYVQL
ncbi:hypothetical protein CJ030_MR1G014160 [Morella rubra]|uniref:Uncharacterized protein n=1 Tax=Morella rubra TaxID=262757 RepID=A0A6A1WP52_9ROSI|nr:hypothetical protein CJ030_MR1G014160 [Morella rubra]